MGGRDYVGVEALSAFFSVDNVVRTWGADVCHMRTRRHCRRRRRRRRCGRGLWCLSLRRRGRRQRPFQREARRSQLSTKCSNSEVAEQEKKDGKRMDDGRGVSLAEFAIVRKRKGKKGNHWRPWLLREFYVSATLRSNQDLR